MSTVQQEGAFRLPTEPYPGLRPFLDHEAALLLGRASQISEIIKRLEQTRFVAVVGGSGSGKSSLIRAGVVPKLRGFGIPDAGAYWIPVICTPGTMPPVVLGWEETATRDRALETTPIARLAWKVSQALTPLATRQEEADRRNEIATVFRQGAGFTRLVDSYHDELPPRGPDNQEARFLFVIDQFEELFHPTNRDNVDAGLLIEAVIDHFFNPHERCFVVITMRSEHLSDCAAYLELPDAINKSLYLVRRLNEQELQDAIVGPAKYFLRLLRRGNDDPGRTLPFDVVFDDAVIERLLEDVAAIAGDADHLPLLQHVLARTWEAARQRESAATGGVPAHVRWADLEHAVAPGQPEGWLREDDGINTLRGCLENWAEFTYRQRSKEERAQIDAVLRNLAFKDPNNGLYFQRRVDVDEPFLLPGISRPREHLRNLLAHGFLDSVHYLFWDDENPDRVTLKVSHESFIRGWQRFRKLIDIEAERFDEFVSVLRKCALWRVDRLPKLLLEASELARVDSANLGGVFEAGDERKAWFHELLQYRDGERLSKVEPDVDQFLAASRARLEEVEREKREAADRERLAKEAEQAAVQAAREAKRQQEIERREHEAQRKQDEANLLRARAEAEKADAVGKRNMWMAVAAGGAALVGLMFAAFAIFIQSPTMQRLSNFTDARFKAEQISPDIRDPADGRRQRENLNTLIEAAALVQSAKLGRLIWKWQADTVLDNFLFLPPVAAAKRLLANSSSEPVVNGSLRNLLTTRVWLAGDSPSGKALNAEMYAGIDCGGERKGSLFVRNDADAGDAGKPGIFMPEFDARRHYEMALFSATLNGTTCRAGDTAIWSVPSYLNPVLVFDAQLNYIGVALKDEARRQDYVNLYSVLWGQDKSDSSHGAMTKLLSLVPDPPADDSSPTVKKSSAADLVRQEVGSERTKVVQTWQADGGIEVSVGERLWRLFSETALPVMRSDDWSLLQPASPGSGCSRLQNGLNKTQGNVGGTWMFQHETACLYITRDTRPGDQPGGSDVSTAHQQVLVKVYVQPQLETTADLNKNLPTPIADFVFGWLPLGKDTNRWWIGHGGGKYEEWIALEQTAGDFLATPWGTAALCSLAKQVPLPESDDLSSSSSHSGSIPDAAGCQPPS
jgi:hypothetical protein